VGNSWNLTGRTNTPVGVEVYDMQDNLLFVCSSMHEASKKTGCTAGHISNILRGMYNGYSNRARYKFKRADGFKSEGK
jgi:ribosomal protein L6P/L9E